MVTQEYSLFDLGSFSLSFLAEAALWKQVLDSAKLPEGKRTLPNKATWVIWTGANALLGIVANETHISFWQIIAYTIGSAAVAAYAIAKDGPGWEDEDKRLIVPVAFMTFAAIAIWWIVEDQTVTIVLILATFTIGAKPLAADIWKDRFCAGWKPWWLYLAGGGCAIAGLGWPSHWEWPGALIPLGCFALELGIVGLITIPWRPARPTGRPVLPGAFRTLAAVPNL